jgi:hypothetical protein
MASVEEFLALLRTDLDSAMREYAFNVSEDLDGDTGKLQACTARTVAFEFKEPNEIWLMPGEEKSKHTSEMWYLPWLRSGTSVANLDGEGPSYFSTSQLTGCRFMVEYLSSNRKSAKVLHLAGDVGTGPKGTKLRDEMAVAIGVDPTDNTGRVRSYSFGSGKKSNPKNVGTNFKLRYDGNKAWVFGVRDGSGAWNFYCQEMNAKIGPSPALNRPAIPDKPLGLRDLSA